MKQFSAVFALPLSGLSFQTLREPSLAVFGSVSVNGDRASADNAATDELSLRHASAGTSFSSGCGKREERISIPSYSPGSVASSALKHYDKSGNGTIEDGELANCPALQMAVPRIDQDGNGKLTDAEISARIATYDTFGVGLMARMCVITLDGQPLANANVRFEPEEFMLGSISPAVGTTDAAGRVSPRKEGSEYPAMQVGMYRIKISRREGEAETIPAQFNSESRLGVEIAPDVPNQERGFALDLRTR
jgi:hypothetical protein